MSCSTDFGLSSASGIVEHRMGCKKALEFMRSLNYSSPEEYLSRVSIVEKHFFSADDKQSYPKLSHRQFQCLLKCAIISKDEKCNEKCFETIDEIRLNFLDR